MKMVGKHITRERRMATAWELKRERCRITENRRLKSRDYTEHNTERASKTTQSYITSYLLHTANYKNTSLHKLGQKTKQKL